jgi:hypothetical protein
MNAYKITGFVRITLEVVAEDQDAAWAYFDSAQLSDFDFHDTEPTEIEDLGTHYAD